MKLHAAERLANAMVSAALSPEDPKTLTKWSLCAAQSVGTLSTWCGAAGLRPKTALDFVRLMRAVGTAHQTGIPARHLLDTVDGRTLSSLLARAGINGHLEQLATLDTFLRSQRLIPCTYTLEVVLRAFADAGVLKNRAVLTATNTVHLTVKGVSADRAHRL